jgi:Chaperone of endosialidase
LLRDFALIATVVAWLASPPALRAINPEPDGGYPIGNTAEGDFALYNVNGNYGTYNTALGYDALHENLQGDHNTATGAGALRKNFANNNTATGANALFFNRDGESNTAVGVDALIANTAGNLNTAIGSEALHGTNSTGSFNTAAGARALLSNQTGGVNLAAGYSAMEANISGFYNVAIGGFALGTNTGGSYNVATGANALYYNKGSSNTGTGHQALQNNTTGNYNVALGYQAGNNLTTGSNNIVIGANVLGAAGDANKIRIGKSIHAATYIGGIYNKSVSSNTTGGGIPVLVDSTGKLGTVKSSARYKEAIKPMDKASEAILALEPVTFRYKQELDPDGVTQFGLIAEHVEKVSPELVVRDEDGKISTVRYEAVNAMLLNEFLKEHRKVEEQQAMIREMKAAVAQQQQEIKALATSLKQQAATIRKVSQQLRTDKSSLHMFVSKE